MARGYRVLCLVLAAPLGDAATLTGRVVGVADGDTVTVLEPAGTWHAIRLAAIDAYEVGQPHATESGQNLSRLALDQGRDLDPQRRGQ